MKNREVMTLLYFLCFGCANSPALANNHHPISQYHLREYSEPWRELIFVKAEDVEHIEKYQLHNDMLIICLHEVVLGKKNFNQGRCDVSVTLKLYTADIPAYTPEYAGNIPALGAEQICNKDASLGGKAWYIVPMGNQNVDYVVKCEGDSVKKSKIASLKVLCSPAYHPFNTAQKETEQKRFCPSPTDLATENRELRTTVNQLQRELDRTKAELKATQEQLKVVKAKAEELTKILETKRCEVRTIGGDRAVVEINHYKLRFFKVKSTYSMGLKKGIRIALTKREAEHFHRKSMALSDARPLYPSILKAVSENQRPRHFAQFWIQEQTIEPQLYGELITGGSADSVSYDDAKKAIEKLNEWCDGKAKFQLPEEKQFVHLARQAYNPVEKTVLQPCDALKDKVALGSVKQLFAHQWQLTSSYCSSFDNKECYDEQSRVKKGGSIDSKYAAECMPEYRAESMPDINEPNTTFRLVLKIPRK